MKRILIIAALVGLVGLVGPAALAQPQPERPTPLLRIQITELTQPLRQFFGAPKEAGVLVGDVAPDGAGAHAGLRVGDVITAVDGRPVAGPDDIRAALASRKEGESAKLQVVRDRRSQALTVVVPKAEAVLPPGARLSGPETYGYRLTQPDGSSYRVDRLEQRLDELERRLQRVEQQPVR